MLGLERLVRESGKPHRVIAAAADCTEATLNRILKGPGPDLQAGHTRSHRGSSGIGGQAGQEGRLAVAGVWRVSEITRLASKDLISLRSLESVMAGLPVAPGK